MLFSSISRSSETLFASRCLMELIASSGIVLPFPSTLVAAMKTFHRFSTLALFLVVLGLANVAFSQGTGGGGGVGGGTGGFGTGGGNTGGGTAFNTDGTNFGNSGNTGTGTGVAAGVNGRKYTNVGAKTQTPITGNRRYANVGAKTGTGAGGIGARGVSGAGAGGIGGLGGGAGLGTSSFGLNQFGTTTASSEATPSVRTRLSSGVVMVPSSQALSQGTVQQNASRSMAQTRFRGVGVTVTNSTTVIGGTVKNESDRRMAELLLRLEPGVSRVENRVTVVP